MAESRIINAQWAGCYDDSWKGYIVEEAFAHPAKFSRGLIERIYKHMLAEGMLRRWDTVVDPFGGIGSGGIVAASLGLRWIGCELEQKFVNLATENFAMHLLTWGQFSDPIPRMVQGDSRKLRECLRGVLAEGVVCSPPYAESISAESSGIDWSKCKDGGRIRDFTKEPGQKMREHAGLAYGQTHGQLGSMPTGSIDSIVSSPPFLDARSDTTPSIKGDTAPTKHNPEAWGADVIVSSPPYSECLRGDNTAKETAEESRAKRITEGGSLGQSCRHQGYGSAENLGNLKAGTVDAICSSPPYAETAVAKNSNGVDLQKQYATYRSQGGGASFEAFTATQAKHSGDYGSAAGQLAALPAGVVDSVVSIPPFEQSNLTTDTAFMAKVERDKRNGSRLQPGLGEYGHSNGQLGNEQGETFWSAARDIVQECHAILKPGGYAAFVVKAFVRDKQIVDFPGDWRKLCEACGFELVQEVRAMLVKEDRHPSLFGGDHVKVTARKSFFRRLYESKYPGNSIDFEVVQFFRKPESP